MITLIGLAADLLIIFCGVWVVGSATIAQLKQKYGWPRRKW